MIKNNFLLLLLIFSIVILNSCSSDSEGGKVDDTGQDVDIRFCKNSAQCKPDEKCSNGICVKKNLEDATYDIIEDSNIQDIDDVDITDVFTDDVIADVDNFTDVDISDIQDVTADITDISDISQEYKIGTMSIYEGAAGVCESDEYLLKSVSGYSGWNILENEEYTINVQARFK